jgi:hypothetical protein
MTKDIDEDLIEATIRRIQAQAPADDGVALEPESPPPDASDDLPGDEDPIEATIRRVQAAREAREANVDAPPAVHQMEPTEDPIEAAIRRVQAATKARHPEPAQTREPASPSEPVIDEPLPVPAAERTAPPVEPTDWPGRDERLLGEPATWQDAALRLEAGLQDAQREVRALSLRVEQLSAAFHQVDSVEPSLRPSEGPPLSVVHPHDEQPEEWDDTPQITRLPFGTPPRPAVLRDPSPMTATAELLVEAETPAEPTPSPHVEPVTAPALEPAARHDGRTFEERMPRQYRITVEDKRRGVDLVPLHRALQGLDNVKDMSLLSYSNGVAIVLVESIGAIDPEPLRAAVARAMSRETKIEVHNEQTMVVKVLEE